MKVRFPMYFEAVCYQTWEIPDDEIEETDDETIRMESIYQWLDDNWCDIPLPDIGECDYVDGTCNFDWEADVEVIDE